MIIKIKNQKSKIKNFQPGFTLIELLVVAGIILTVIGAAVASFFSSLRGATKTTIVNEVKQNGDYALSVMERMIRNAKSIPSIETVCNGSNLTSFTIDNPDERQTTFVCPTTGSEVRIASNSSYLTSYLTSDRVAVSNCSFTCIRPTLTPGSLTPPFFPAVVKIFFNIHQPSAAGVTLRPEERISINYETSVVARNTGF